MNKYENGSFILFTLVPYQVPFIAHLHIILSLQVFHCPDLFVKQIMPYRSSSRFNCKGSKQKWGWSRGVEPLGGVRGQSPLKLTLFGGQIMTKALTEYVFLINLTTERLF